MPSSSCRRQIKKLPCQLATVKKKLALLSDWSTVLGLTLLSGAAGKSLGERLKCARRCERRECKGHTCLFSTCLHRKIMGK